MTNLKAKTKPTPYVHFRGIRCGCTGCREPAVAQFYICSLDAWTAICDAHDLEINLLALRVVLTFDEANLCIKNYVRSPASKQKSNDSSCELKPADEPAQPRLTLV